MSSVSIPESVTSIGRDAFYGCNNLSIINGAVDSYAHIYAVENGYRFKNNGELILGDVDEDGEITLNDVNLILKAALNIIQL